MLGLAQGEGITTFEGDRYRSLKNGTSRIGVYLGPTTFHPNFTASQHLRVSAFTRGISLKRVSQVLEIVGLQSASRTKTKAMSTGMLQKLGIATALLSEPEVLILDEPANGLDPQSVQWLRNYLNDFAEKGGTVLISSHLINEIALFADNLLVLGRGQLLASESLDAFLRRQKPTAFKVRADKSELLQTALEKANMEQKRLSEDVIEIFASSAKAFAKIAVENDIELSEVVPVGSSLEDVFLALTAGKSEYAAKTDDQNNLGKGEK